MIVAIIGPDGSGKTTIAERIVVELKQRGIRAQHYPFNFGILPKLSSFKYRTEGPKSTEKDLPDDACTVVKRDYDLQANSPLGSFIYMSWYGLDYMLGGLFLWFRNLFGRNREIAIFARYFYDYYYQTNNRLLSTRVKRAIELIVPRPAFIIFLDRDALDIHNGKPELPVEEIENQQRIIRELLQDYPQFREIDARSGIKDTVRKVFEVIHCEEQPVRKV